MITTRLPHISRIVAPLGLAFATAACSFSIGSSGPDYDKLEASIVDQLDTSFESFDTTATGVDCPRQSGDLSTGDTFICSAQLVDLDGDMRVLVEVMNDDLDVEFSTLDLLYDMRDVEAAIVADLEPQVGAGVTVECGDVRLQAIEGGDAFSCGATDADGFTATVDVVTDNDGNIRWTVTPDE